MSGAGVEHEAKSGALLNSIGNGAAACMASNDTVKSITVHRQAQKRVLVVLLVLLTAVCAVSCIGLSIVSGLAPVRKPVWNVFTMWGCGHCSQELVD